MSDEKWNRFAATGSVRDYLEYRACFSYEETARGRRSRKGNDTCAKQAGAVKLRSC